MSDRPDESPRWLDRPESVRLILRVFYACCAGLLLLELVIHRHYEHPWEGWFGFHCLYGLVACVLLVLAAKQMRRVLMRDEDYYDR